MGESCLQELHKQVAELQQRLNQNSTNSSKPPSSDPPALKRSPPKPPSTHKVGGQHGHAKAQCALVEHPDTIHDCKPTVCRHCQQPLDGDDPQPLRHQVWDVPPIRPVVTEYRRHRLRCPRCGVTTCGQAASGQDGPRLKAACILLTGAYRLSKAKAARLLGDLFAIPLCAGQVCAIEAEVGQQLHSVVEELRTAGRQQPANVDETSMGRGRWLWVMMTGAVTIYQIVRGRNRDALRQLLGEDYRRVLTSDRHKVYDHLAEDRHQLCWSHLRRDFQAMVDRRNASSVIGRELLAMSGQMLRILPGKARQASRPKVLAAIDTSGSITPELLTLIDGELSRLAKHHEVTVVECDARIHAVYPYRKLDQVHDRGGTDLRPPLEKAFLGQHKPDLVVYFTDGYGPAHLKAPRVPLIWCLLPGGRVPAPWGRRVHMK
jgi:hypothetical protein